ncbi:hypothetical protein FOQG_04779 [Fusarium oxysporum f. sp. raphani 54005]|uniref:Uncharacterized protein n=5 Tax=Fusarium oxysporum TaxID=5507 RepID=X0CH39_FUSOX|nr:hypothetical protein FOXB_03296 [Fusarium oxysporum f. sp. conglutinans Fo5176]EXA54534.1 hypothetical protein FOVG_01980 [Fusarium oxysporum f. sp. pisi HDV247]EXK93511.1 hypothetical protein FOQG_04779 [Fusarium oxysporum f. sp. raphani 54005]EXL81032.1 hypothetical protein FOPG_05707 [Fusarium oxysporum f. sp. conglutinans race 2 54008]KAG6991786.1 hypothetical protein FocnCong_v019488 [Fusarium oxysporum f. sp. conglutinans]KAG7438079.1 hypothetical protein Forpi1262_v001780 [Fusarium o
MSYSSQRYDLDAAAARKRNSVCSNHGAYSDYDRRRNSRSSSSRTSDSYSRRSGEFEMPCHMRWEQQHHHPRRDQNLRPRRGSASCPVLDDYSHLNRERRASNDRRRPRSDRGRDRSPQEEINTMLNSGRAPKIKRGSTYGTYIMPLDMRGQYQTSDPTKCTCRCCPHPTGISHSHDNYGHMSDVHATSRSRSHPPHRYNRKGRPIFEVYDNTRNGMRCENSFSFTISVNPRASCDRIVAFLAPDKRYAKVLVHWNNGTVQKLDSNVPMGDLLEYTEYLEIREVKQVRWVA